LDIDSKKASDADGDFAVVEYATQVSVSELAAIFSAAFPRRAPGFFSSAIGAVNGRESKLFLLLVQGRIRGGMFAFCVEDRLAPLAWNPSYWFVHEGFRSYGLHFLLRVRRSVGGRILDVSPTAEVQQLLAGLKFKEVTIGSLIQPVLLPSLRLTRSRLTRGAPESAASPRFLGRGDLLWYTFTDGKRISPVCVKRSARYGIVVFILVYFDRSLVSPILGALRRDLAKRSPFSVLIAPRFGGESPRLAVSSSKFHAFANFVGDSPMYSILGSEVTEII
jgi:hypothetical protein